jgi:hypothetical protein
MRTQTRTKPPTFRDRAERLRAARTAAPALRGVWPTVTRINVELQFLPAAAPPHASQSFVLYPAAKAYFTYPCPYGDCDGTYNLDVEAGRAMASQRGHEGRVTGTLECVGMRSREGLPRQSCGLHVHYTISATHEADKTG